MSRAVCPQPLQRSNYSFWNIFLLTFQDPVWREPLVVLTDIVREPPGLTWRIVPHIQKQTY